MQNSNNMMDRSLFAYSKKDARWNCPASEKVVEKAPSSSRFSFIFFTQIFLFSFFSFFASSSLSQNNKDNCKKMMVVNRRHFGNNDFMSWSCFDLESQLHVSTYAQKYTHGSKTLRKTKFAHKHLSKLDARPYVEKYANVNTA